MIDSQMYCMKHHLNKNYQTNWLNMSDICDDGYSFIPMFITLPKLYAIYLTSTYGSVQKFDLYTTQLIQNLPFFYIIPKWYRNIL